VPDFVHPTNRSVVSLENPTPDKVQRLLDAGYTPREVTTDVAPGGQLRLRTADPSSVESDPNRRLATEADSAAMRDRAYEEGISRDAQSLSSQALIGGSTFLSDVTLGGSTALGFDARALLPERERALVREQTGGAEAISHLLGAVSPVGAEALISRGASWMGSAALRLGAEGAAGGTFNALQEAMIARDPDVFAERLLGDMGIGALLGASLGAPISAVSGLRRLGRGTSAARANREVADAALDVPTGIMEVQEIDDLVNAAINPQGAVGGVQRALGGAASPAGNFQGVRRLERAVQRHQGVNPQQFEEVGEALAQRIEDLRAGRGMLAQLDPNVRLPAATADAVPQLRSRLGRLREDLRALDAPNANIASALRRISQALEVSEGATPNQAFGQLYNAPRAINRAVENLSPVDLDQLNGALGFRGAAQGTSDLLSEGGGLRQLTEGLDRMMEEPVFGQAGQFLASRRQALRQVDDALEGIRQNFDMLSDGRVADPGVLRRVIREAEATGDLEKLRRLADVNAQVEVLRTDELFPELRRLGEGGMGRRLEEFIEGSYAVAAVRKIEDLEQQASKGVQQGIRQVFSGGGIAAAGAGVALASPIGIIGGIGVAGLAAAARSPFAMVRMAAKVRNAFDSQGARLGRSLDTTTRMAHSSSRMPFTRRISPRAGSLAAFALNKNLEEKGEMYSELVERIQEMQENPMAMAEALTPQTEVLGDMIPGLNTAAGMQGHRQLAALTAALPLSARTQSALARLSGPPPLPSATAINEFLQVAAVVEDPVHGVELMNAGRLNRASAAAIATAFPNFHEEVTARIVSDIARAAERRTRRRRGGTRGPRMNYQASLMMSRFVGFPLDNTMEAGFQSGVTSQAAQTSQQESAQFSRPVSTREPSFLQTEQTVTGRIGD